MYMTLVVVYVCSMYISQKWDPSQSHEEKKPQYEIYLLYTS